MTQKQAFIAGVIKTAERAARQTQEVSCAVDPDAEDAACRCAEWYKKILASARPEIQRRHRSLQSRRIAVHLATSKGIAEKSQCCPRNDTVGSDARHA